MKFKDKTDQEQIRQANSPMLAARMGIVEHTENDAYWGDGGAGKGRNMLGRLLTDVREMLRSDGIDDTQ